MDNSYNELAIENLPEFTEEDLDRFIPHLFQIMSDCLKNPDYKKDINHLTKNRKRRIAYKEKHEKNKRKRSG